MLGFPKQWIQREVLGGGIFPALNDEQRTQLKLHVGAFQALIDSLGNTKTGNQTGAKVVPQGGAEHIRRQLTAELGAMRAVLNSEQHPAFDVIARMWAREQAR